MIGEITLTKSNEVLTEFSINSVPSLMVVAGSNGSGKTALLRLLNSISESRTTLDITVQSSESLRNKIKFVPVGFSPEDIGANSNNARPQSEKRSKEFIQYFLKGLWNQPRYNDLALQVIREFHPEMKELDSDSTKFVQNLTEADVYAKLPSDYSLSLARFDNNNFIAEVCITHLNRLQNKKLELYERGLIKPVTEIEKDIGKPPWGRINDLFEKYGFPYRLSAPQSGVDYTPMFHEAQSPARLISFSSLSTGEKILVTLVLWAYNSHQRTHYRVLLLDEFDAHLNPALAKMMMEIIAETLVREHDLQVIMTTHSPSTVAFTPPGSLFWMERGRPIREASVSEVVPLLSDGFVAIQEDTALGFVGLLVEKSPKPILCVEGKTDKMILEVAWSKLYENEPLPFQIHDVFDCHFLMNMFVRGDIFANYPDTKFLGLLDFDSAFSVAKEKSEKKGWTVKVCERPHQVIFKVPNAKGALVTLPVPAFRENYAGFDLSNSYLSIELLFEDEIIGEYCVAQAVAGGAKLLKFKDRKKKNFATQVAKLDSKHFGNFRPLFENLVELFESSD